MGVGHGAMPPPSSWFLGRGPKYHLPPPPQSQSQKLLCEKHRYVSRNCCEAIRFPVVKSVMNYKKVKNSQPGRLSAMFQTFVLHLVLLASSQPVIFSPQNVCNNMCLSLFHIRLRTSRMDPFGLPSRPFKWQFSYSYASKSDL